MRNTLVNGFQRLATAAVCILLLLCFCFPAQSQLIKVPFIGIVGLAGMLSLYRSRGKAISGQIWIWFGGYLAYNLIWSILGFANDHSGASGYFRLGVIWPVVFLFIIAAINSERVKWLGVTLHVILAFQMLAVILLVGYGLQLWPNVLEWIFPTSAVGIHLGYLHVVGHFIGGMAFTVPYAYSRAVLDHGAKPGIQAALICAWLVVIFSVVATSRRILYIVIFVCAAAMLIVPLIHKENRGKLLKRAVAGLVITGAFFLLSTNLIAGISSDFLHRNYRDIVLFIQGRYELEGSGRLMYTENLVFGIDPLIPTQGEDPTNPTAPGTETDPSGEQSEPTAPTNDSAISGFNDRMEGMAEDLQGESVRGRIISSVLQNWPENPVFGVGFGAQLPGYPTNPDSIYEMEFVVRLYTTGIAGILCLLALLLYVGLALLGQVRKHSAQLLTLLPVAAAYLGAVVATLSNPYIFSGFDYLFMLFLPAAFLNSSLVNEKKGKQQENRN